jgi:histidyl-tRNA synthetase
MYSFTDRGGEEISLRPEGTAGVMRAVLENGLTQSLPLKFFYAGPMFRYERPQKGRYRQFHQIGTELIGPAQPQADIEIIAVGADILKALGIGDKCRLELNTLGDNASRAAYREALVGYFSHFTGELSDDSRDRLTRNPLRILDSKDEGDRRIIADAPAFDDFLNEASRRFFAQVMEGLAAVGIGFTRNERLVRGLDYYRHTAFEFVTEQLGSQGTVLGGGRYDGLSATLGGPDLPAVGWAAGIERLAMLVDELAEDPAPIAVIPVGSAVDLRALQLTQQLRGQGFHVDLAYGGNVGKRMKRADKLNCRVALVLGEDELTRNAVMLRDLAKGEQQEVPLDRLTAALADYR